MFVLSVMASAGLLLLLLVSSSLLISMVNTAALGTDDLLQKLAQHMTQTVNEDHKSTPKGEDKPHSPTVVDPSHSPHETHHHKKELTRAKS